MNEMTATLFMKFERLVQADQVPRLQPENQWLLDHLHPRLQVQGPLGLFYWQWLALPLGLCLAWFAGALLGRVTRAVGGANAPEPSCTNIAGTFPRPLRLAWAVALCWLLLPSLR